MHLLYHYSAKSVAAIGRTHYCTDVLCEANGMLAWAKVMLSTTFFVVGLSTEILHINSQTWVGNESSKLIRIIYPITLFFPWHFHDNTLVDVAPLKLLTMA